MDVTLKHRNLPYLFMALLVVVTLQDYLLSVRNHYSFFISESVLFNSFWLWFLPVTLVSRRYSGSLLYFVAMAMSLHFLFYTASVSIISFLFYSGHYSLTKMMTYTISNDFYKYVIAYSLIGYYVYRNEKKTKPHTHKNLLVQVGRSRILIPIDDILYIQTDAPYLTVHTQNAKHLHNATLKGTLTELPEVFMQVHKSALVNLQKVVSYKSRLNGDYDIFLENGQEIRLSRNFAADFKKSLISLA